MLVEFLPLIAVLLLSSIPLLTPVSDRLDLAVTQLALAVFGEYTEQRRSANTIQVQRLKSAHIGEIYRVYASKTLLYATLLALMGSVGGVYLFVGVRSVLVTTEILGQLPGFLQFLATDPADMGLVELFSILLLSSATLGVFAGFVTYRLRWSVPRYLAGERERRIDATLKQNVAFIYALSRSGMPFADILRILSAHTEVYGETSREIGVTVKDMDLFGTDLITALERSRDRTPSEEFEEFLENLGSVLRSGQSIPEFLHEQYEHFLDEEEAQQQQFLELLGTLAEAYVTVFVAGPLFLITILVVIGLLLGGTLAFLQALVYLILPLSTIGFVIYLDSITEDIQFDAEETEIEETSGIFSDIRFAEEVKPTVTDGGTDSNAANWARLAIHRRIRPLVRRLSDPIRLLTENPIEILYVTVPLGLLWVGLQWWPSLSAGSLEVSAYDDPLIQAVLFVTGTFAVVYDLNRRRIKNIEAGVPDLLDRLAATNEAGMAIVDSFDRVVRSDLGALTMEMRRTWADINWGAHVETALQRFRQRVQTPAITRVVTLTTNAMSATNDIGPVLRIAADEAISTRRLERDRRNELLTYTVVVYISLLVFLVIVVALDTVFIPSIPTGESFGTTGSSPVGGLGLGGNLQQLTQETKDAYSLLFFHGGIVQGYFSGFVAGQMEDGSLKAGAKHATIMMAIAYGLFLIFG